MVARWRQIRGPMENRDIDGKEGPTGPESCYYRTRGKMSMRFTSIDLSQGWKKIIFKTKQCNIFT